MKSTINYIIICCAICITLNTKAQPPIESFIKWQQTIGGTAQDVMTSVCIDADSAIIMCGYSNSGKSGNKSSNGFGGYDYWVVKMNARGIIVWDKTFGGDKDDYAAQVIATRDGGYLIGGTSISPKSGNKTSVCYINSADYWLVKLDKKGNKVWDKTYGGWFTDNLTTLIQLPTGEFVAGGYSYSDISGTKNADNIGNNNTADYWSLILNNDGSIAHQGTYGGTSDDKMTCAATAGANGIFLGGSSYSLRQTGYKTSSSISNSDYWIMQTDITGKRGFDFSFGGDRSDFLTAMKPLIDNSLVVAGYSNSSKSEVKSRGLFGVTDYWMMKLNSKGQQEWNKVIGGDSADYLVTLQTTSDDGFILGGYSNSKSGKSKSEKSRGLFDYWLVKTDSDGNKLWDKTLGGNSDDKLAGVFEIAPDKFIVAGTSYSRKSGDKTSNNTGNNSAADFWIMRLDVKVLSFADNNDLKTNKMPEGKNVFDFNIVSNPVNDKLIISYSAKQNSNATFSIYSAEGKMIQQGNVTASANINTHEFNIGNLANGTYYVVMLSADGNKASKTFIKQ